MPGDNWSYDYEREVASWPEDIKAIRESLAKLYGITVQDDRVIASFWTWRSAQFDAQWLSYSDMDAEVREWFPLYLQSGEEG